MYGLTWGSNPGSPECEQSTPPLDQSANFDLLSFSSCKCKDKDIITFLRIFLEFILFKMTFTWMSETFLHIPNVVQFRTNFAWESATIPQTSQKFRKLTKTKFTRLNKHRLERTKRGSKQTLINIFHEY